MTTTVYMRFNQPNAKWEVSPYTWDAAIRALGNSYDLRKVEKDEAGEVTDDQIREKTPIQVAQSSLLAGASNSTTAFEAFWLREGEQYGPDNQATIRSVFLAGWNARG